MRSGLEGERSEVEPSRVCGEELTELREEDSAAGLLKEKYRCSQAQ